MRIALVLFAAGLAVLAACTRTAPASAALPKIALTDPRYKDLVFLVATVRKAGTDFLITNDSTQPWFDVTLVLVGPQAEEYRYQTSEVDPGQTVTAPAGAFASMQGVPFDATRIVAHTLIVSAEIGEGGPTGAYAVRL